jgi:hypothetical protein
MSADEMREYCRSLSQFQLRVEVRLKNARDTLHGKITNVTSDRFEIAGDNNSTQQVRFIWVARIRNAA